MCFAGSARCGPARRALEPGRLAPGLLLAEGMAQSTRLQLNLQTAPPMAALAHTDGRALPSPPTRLPFFSPIPVFALLWVSVSKPEGRKLSQSLCLPQVVSGSCELPCWIAAQGLRARLGSCKTEVCWAACVSNAAHAADSRNPLTCTRDKLPPTFQ